MKNVCNTCKYSKNKGEGIYCVKYGIVIYRERMYCIAWERDTDEQKQTVLASGTEVRE